ncbi:ABC transporter permease [Coprothermobacter platensis]|uniref:ABC transporter permease n=1 Tax=Coprothermobacter platensis TaxID=108819 RepID=UPI00035ED73E|nr:ABC transporter permease [Coprothermobacter platensis]
MIGLCRRNIKVFFRDRAAVFFSLLSGLIIIGLYALFLGDVWASSLSDITNAREIINSWLISGLVAVISFTSSLGAYAVMVDDSTKGIRKDFFSSPISKERIVGGYFLSNLLTSFVVTLVTLAVGEVFIVLEGGELISLTTLLKVLATILMTILMNSSILFVVVSFVKTQSTFSLISTIVGTLIGFLTGIYVPIGQLNASMQWLIKVFPLSHAAALLRQLMMDSPMRYGFASFPQSATDKFKAIMGVNLSLGGHLLAPWMHVAVILLTTGVFYLISIGIVSRMRNAA